MTYQMKAKTNTNLNFTFYSITLVSSGINKQHGSFTENVYSLTSKGCQNWYQKMETYV